MKNQVRLLELCGLLCVLAVLVGCHKRVPAAAIPAAAPSAAAPAAPGPPTCVLTAEPATVTAGESATLSWTSTNASSLELKPTLGQQQAEGSASITPSDSTTYTMSLSGAGGTGECSARVTVTPAIPPAPSVAESNIPASTVGAQQMKDAFFDFNKSSIRPDAQKALTHDADYLKAHPDLKVRIGGYCDQRGSEEYNLGLGERRAESAKQFLVNLGVPADDVTTISYGKDRPFCTDTTDACYQQNRRAQVVIVNSQGS
ncbi:MAG: OmpA family protein [Terriglobia bacterium]